MAVALVLAYLLWRGAHHHKHSNRDWDAIVGQLRQGNSWRDQLHNSRLVMELVRYADRHGEVDALLLAKLHRDAVQRRLVVLGFGRSAVSS